jgi:hypothetical protein
MLSVLIGPTPNRIRIICATRPEGQVRPRADLNAVITPSLSEALEAIRIVNRFYEARAGNSKIVSQIMGIEGHLENQYWASRKRQMKITDYSTLT